MYIIRKRAYQFNDGWYEFQREGEIEFESENYEEAYQLWRAKEIAAFREMMFFRMEELVVGDHTGATHAKAALGEYLQTTFGYDAENIYEYMEAPSDATDDQIWEIRRITGISCYHLLSFEEAPHFYLLEIKGAATYHGRNEIVNWDDDPIFFNSPEEAMRHLGRYLMHFTLDGSPEELSDMPDVLRQIIQSDNIFGYREEQKKIDVQIHYGREHDSGHILTQFFETLREPLLTFHKITLEEAKNIKYPTYG